MPIDPPPLVGRAAVLAEVVGRARAGLGSAFTGPFGSGGSRLLDEVQQSLRRTGARTGRLRLVRPGGAATGSPFLALLDRSAIEALPDGDRGALRDALLELDLDLLAVEDAHLLDASDGAMIAELAKAGTVIVANATGPGGMADALRLLVDEDRVLPTPLGPLLDTEVAELAEELLGDPVDDELAHALMVASAGRPGALSELVDDAVGARSVTHADGLWRLAAPLPAPRSVRAAVLEAFSALPPDQRGWIAAVATAGSLALDLARRIATPGAIAAAREAEWTVDDGVVARMAFSPVAMAVVASLGVRARIAVLRRLIDAASSAERPLTDEERVALLRWRIELGDAPQPEEALELALRPQTRADDREVLLRAALEGGAAAGAALADHLRRTRRPKEALELIAAALPGAESEDERVSLIRVASLTTGIVERRSLEALEALDAHLEHSRQHPDLVAVRAGLLLLEGRPEEAVDTARAVLGEEGRSEFAAAFASLQVVVGRRDLGDLHGALEAAERFAELDGIREATAPGTALASWLPSEITVAVAAELDPAATTLAAARDAVPADRRTTMRPPFAYSLGGIRTLQADPVAAIRLLREADAGSGPWREAWWPLILAELTIAQTLAGATDEARSTHERLLRTTHPPRQRGRVRLATAQVLAARGETEAAIEIAVAVAAEGRRLGLPLDEFDGTFAAVRYGDPTAAERLLALGSGLAGIGRHAQRAYAGALVAADPAAVDLAAQMLWDSGLRLHAIEAAGRAADLGSTAAAQRLVAWLARSPGLAVQGAGSGLTTREREVALLAARGNSDRTIAAELGITLRTAQTHLSRALTKLGVHRRTDLPRLIDEP